MFAMSVPGLARLAARELEELGAVEVQDSGFDGRSDVLLFDAGPGARADVLAARLVEDVFVEVGRTLRTEGDNPRWIAGRIWRPERVERALSLWAQAVAPLRTTMTFRVIARVLQERFFLRTDLRRELTRVIERNRPRWRQADPAQIEVWSTEYRPGRFVAGLRLSDVRMRQHEGREAERRGALRPTVAAAIVRLAGEARGVLLDPCCGSGTILAEARAVGWEARGSDIAPHAAGVARKNVPNAEISVGDARSLNLHQGSVGACVSNLPFGEQFTVQEDMADWLRAVLGEMARVTRPGGTVVLLARDIPRVVVPEQLIFRERFKISLLGTSTSIWSYTRRA